MDAERYICHLYCLATISTDYVNKSGKYQYIEHQCLFSEICSQNGCLKSGGAYIHGMLVIFW